MHGFIETVIHKRNLKSLLLKLSAVESYSKKECLPLILFKQYSIVMSDAADSFMDILLKDIHINT